MIKGREMTAILTVILLLAMAGAREWIADMWKQMKGIERFLWALAFSTVIGGALCWAFADIVYQWGAWLMSASAF